MNIDHINPFIQSSQRVLGMTCNEEPKLCKIFIKKPPYKREEISIVIGIHGQIEGQVIFTMNSKTAMSIASKMMMGMPVSELDDLSKSAISELTNMITGNVATSFSKKDILIDITPPTLIVGIEQGSAHNSAIAAMVCIPLAFEDGNIFEIDVYFTE